MPAFMTISITVSVRGSMQEGRKSETLLKTDQLNWHGIPRSIKDPKTQKKAPKLNVNSKRAQHAPG